MIKLFSFLDHSALHFLEKMGGIIASKSGVLRNFAKFTGKHLRPEACNFIKKKTLAQVFSSKFCEISENTF